MARRLRRCGVYAIRCLVSGAVYVGSSVDIDRRWNNHEHLLKGGRHYNRRLQDEWNNHGRAAFSFGVVVLAGRHELVELEREHTARARACGVVLNVSNNPMAGRGCKPRADLSALPWDQVAWAEKGDRRIARELGCSANAVIARRPHDVPTPGGSRSYIASATKKSLSILSDDEKRARSRRLLAARTPITEARRIEACRQSVSVAHRLIGVDWSKPNTQIARECRVSDVTVRTYRLRMSRKAA